MTEHDRELNRTNPARRLGAAGLVLVIAEWHEWMVHHEPMGVGRVAGEEWHIRFAYARGMATSALAEYRLACELALAWAALDAARGSHD